MILSTGGASYQGGGFLGGCLLLGGASSGGSAPSCGVPGGDPPGWLLLRAVRILLECILVILSRLITVFENRFLTKIDFKKVIFIYSII